MSNFNNGPCIVACAFVNTLKVKEDVNCSSRTLSTKYLVFIPLECIKQRETWLVNGRKYEERSAGVSKDSIEEIFNNVVYNMFM